MDGDRGEAGPGAGGVTGEGAPQSLTGARGRQKSVRSSSGPGRR